MEYSVHEVWGQSSWETEQKAIGKKIWVKIKRCYWSDLGDPTFHSQEFKKERTEITEGRKLSKQKFLRDNGRVSLNIKSLCSAQYK